MCSACSAPGAAGPARPAGCGHGLASDSRSAGLRSPGTWLPTSSGRPIRAAFNYKGAALVAYERVVDDFSGGADDATTARDIEVAIRQLDEAAAQSRNRAASGSLDALSAQLQTVLSDVRARMPVPRAVLQTLNRDSALADEACGTVRL